MKQIIIIILIFLYICLIYILYQFYNKNNNEFNNSTFIISPSDYYIINNKIIENKYNHSEQILKMIDIKDDLLVKLVNIRKKINKNLIYLVKKKDEKYRIEIYLYSKNITDLDYNNLDQIKFRKDINIILNEFNQKYNNNIEKILNENKVLLISFDLELEDSSFNNKLHFYIKNLNELENIDFTFTYDIDNNEFTKESDYIRVLNYDKLSEILINYDMNYNEFINELKEISENPSSIMFHYKYYNNSIGIYLFGNDINNLEKFLDKYNHKKLITDKNNLENLTFELVVNYDINLGKINGTGFSDYF